MGILDDLKAKLSGAVGGAPSQAGGNPIVGHVLQMINDPRTGGLQGLVQTFKDKGMGGIVSSWVGTGANQPITSDQIAHALGADRVQQIAQATQAQPSAVASQLATILPSIIDRLTPKGVIPEGGALAQGLATLRGALAPPETPATTQKT